MPLIMWWDVPVPWILVGCILIWGAVSLLCRRFRRFR